VNGRRADFSGCCPRAAVHPIIFSTTTRPGIVGWEPKRYWRGPAWAVINWLLIDGLKRNRNTDAADDLRRSTIAAIESEGFAEYFDPVTGERCGGLGFSWTATAYLWLIST
jgi:glycogen debranching enzyme